MGGDEIWDGVAIEVAKSIPGAYVVRVLERLIAERGAPDVIVMENGPEFTSRALDAWAPHARRNIESWRRDYNEVRPHSALGNLPPREFAERAA